MRTRPSSRVTSRRCSAHLSALGISVHLPVTTTRAVAATSTRKTTTAKAAKAAAAKKAAGRQAGERRGEEGRAGQEGRRQEGRGRRQVAVAEVVLGPDGKKILPDLPDEQFEKDVKADPTIEEDEKSATFVVSAADDTDEPEQQVMVAGATADPVKDYLKQIGKVPLLNAEMEVELAKRIEAGLFAEEKLAKGGKMSAASSTRSSSGSPRTASAPRTTSSRPTCDSSSRWPSATPVAACSSWT